MNHMIPDKITNSYNSARSSIPNNFEVGEKVKINGEYRATILKKNNCSAIVKFERDGDRACISYDNMVAL